MSADVRPSVEHLRAMMSPSGIVQFAQGRTPDYASGTCVDDNARAWLVAMYALSVDPAYRHMRDIGDTAAEFVLRAQRPDGLFHNMADALGRHIDEIGSQDSIGRAVWACGTAARSSVVPEWRAAAIAALEAAQPALAQLTANHARAYSVIGISAALAPEAASPLRTMGAALDPPLRHRLSQTLTALADALDDDFRSYSSDDWNWWTNQLTWGNGRLPEAMLRAYAATGVRRYAETGLRSLEFLGEITQSNNLFIPIGNDGWYSRGGERAIYDQQPIEACAMVDVWLAAYRISGDAEHLRRARVAFEWFNGLNTERLALADVETGGCHDGLLPGDINCNQGAESTLSYLHAALAMSVAA